MPESFPALELVADEARSLADATELGAATGSALGDASGLASALSTDVLLAMVIVGDLPGPRALKSTAEASQKLLRAAKLMDHHLLPQQFGKFFAALGINIHAYTVTLSETVHLRGVHGSGLGDLAGRWNQIWKKWIEANPNATAKDVYQQLGRMMDDFNLSVFDIHEYGH